MSVSVEEAGSRMSDREHEAEAALAALEADA